MIKFLFLTIPSQSTYQSFKSPIKFKQDIYGVSTWTMKHPLTIYSSDMKYKHVFKQNEVKIQQVNNVSLQEKWKYFVITKGDGGKYYCTSQIIYEKGLLKMSGNTNKSEFFNSYKNINSFVSTQQFYLPKCIVMVSQLPYFKLQVNLLKIHKQLKKKQPAISYCIQEDLYDLYVELLQTGKQKQFDNINLLDYPSKRKSYCPMELIFSYYVECCNNHSVGECIYIQKASNREVLHLYKLQTSTLYQIGYFFHLPFSPFTLRKIISGILTEKQLIFSSSNSNLTVMVIQTLMQMILPLKWCYMYAPNLPIQLLQAAQQSFMPYIVGISKQHLPLISKSNKLIIHIDTDQVQINYDQQQQQLHLLSKKFQQFLLCKTNSNKHYLQWQKQLRINSILMITTIFKKDIGTQRILGGDYFSQEQKLSQKKFYEQFLNKSMMYRKLIQDVHQNVYLQFYRLVKMDFNQRKAHLQNKFNNLHSQTIYPTKCDNKKKWIKFYQKYMRQKRKTRLNRHSLSMVEHNLIGVGGHVNHGNQPFYGSNVSLNSLNSSNRLENYHNNNMNNYQQNNTHTFRSKLANNNPSLNNNQNQLYQSTISTQSLNSQASTLKFNIHNTNPTEQKPFNTSSSKKLMFQNHQSIQNPSNNKQFFSKRNIILNNMNINSTKKEQNQFGNMKQHSSHKHIGISISGNSQVNEFQSGGKTNRKTFHTLTGQNSGINLNSSQKDTNKILGPNYSNEMENNVFLNNKRNSQVVENVSSSSKHLNLGPSPQYSYLAMNNNFSNNSNSNSLIKNSNNPTHQSYIFSSPQPHPLNQSMVNSVISPGTYQSRLSNFKPMGNLSSISSHRNLNQTQSTVVL